MRPVKPNPLEKFAECWEKKVENITESRVFNSDEIWGVSRACKTWTQSFRVTFVMFYQLSQEESHNSSGQKNCKHGSQTFGWFQCNFFVLSIWPLIGTNLCLDFWSKESLPLPVFLVLSEYQLAPAGLQKAYSTTVVFHFREVDT